MTLRLLYFIYVLWVLTKAAKLYYWVFIVCPLVEQQNKSNLLVILHQTNLTNKVRLYTQSTIIKKNKKHKLKKNNKKRKPKKDTFKKINKTVTGNQNTDPKNPKIIWLVLLTILIFLFHDELNSCPSLYTELSSIKGSTVYCESPNPQRLEESSEPVSDANAELLAGEPLGQVINFPPNVNLANEPLEQPALEEVRVRLQVAPEDQAALEKLKEYLKKTLPRQAASDDSISIVTAVSNGEEGILADFEQGECPNLYFPEVVSLEHDAAPEWFPEFVSEINDVPRQPANPALLGANDNSCFVSVASADINPAPANGPGSVNAAESPRGQAVPEHQAASDADDSISNTSNASLDAPSPKRAKKR